MLCIHLAQLVQIHVSGQLKEHLQGHKAGGENRPLLGHGFKLGYNLSASPNFRKLFLLIKCPYPGIPKTVGVAILLFEIKDAAAGFPLKFQIKAALLTVSLALCLKPSRSLIPQGACSEIQA